jgi:hypothetical protein
MGLLASAAVVGLTVGVGLLIVVAHLSNQEAAAPSKQTASRSEERLQPTGDRQWEVAREVARVNKAEGNTSRHDRTPAAKDEDQGPAKLDLETPRSAGGARDRDTMPATTERAAVADSAPAKAGTVQQPSEKEKPRATDEDRKEKQQDLPDVALVIPEDTRPEVRAILKENAINLRSKIGSERVKAAEVLGELKEQGKPVRGLLCQALLDPYEAVRVAAADALKNIDPKMQYLAVGLLTEEDASKVRELLAKIQKLEEDGEPLSRLVVHCAQRSAAVNDVGILSQELTTLSHIAKNDRTACRAIISALGNPSELVRRSAIQALSRMKHSGLALSRLLTLLQTETPENRLAVIHTLVTAADKTTEETVAKAIAGQRLHKEEKVRRAVDEALNKLQYKKDY